MSAGPPCERCGTNSYEPSSFDGKCPFCRKHKRRGSREELIEVLADAKHCILAQAGFIGGVSLLNEEQMRNLVRETVKQIDDV